MNLACVLSAAAIYAEDAPPKRFPNPFFAYDNGTGGPQAPCGQQVKMLKELGYDGICVIGMQGIPEMLKALDAEGLKMLSIYGGASVDPGQPTCPADLKAAIEQLKGRGVQIWLPIAGGTPSSDALDDRAVAILREVADLAEKSGLQVAIYPHFGCYVARTDDALRLVKKTDRKNVGLCFNLCHFLKAEDEKDMEARLKESLPYLLAVNINGADSGKTNDMEWNRIIQTLDRGSFDLGRLLAVLKKLDYRGPIALQSFGITGDCRENLTRSMRKWRELTSASGSDPK